MSYCVSREREREREEKEEKGKGRWGQAGPSLGAERMEKENAREIEGKCGIQSRERKWPEKVPTV